MADDDSGFGENPEQPQEPHEHHDEEHHDASPPEETHEQHEDDAPRNTRQVDDGRPKPILHKPSSGGGLSSMKLLIIAFLVVIIGAGGYLFYKLKTRRRTWTPAPAVAVKIPAAVDTSHRQAPPPQMQTAPAAVPPASNAMAEKSMKGKKGKAGKKEMKAQKEPAMAAVTKAPPKPASEHAPATQRAPASQTAPAKTTGAAHMTNANSGQFTIFVGAFKSEASAKDVEGRWTDAGFPAFITTKDHFYRVSLGKYQTKADAKKEADGMKDAFEDGYYVGTVD